MSDYGGRPYRQNDTRAGQSVQCHQSVWMARWTQTSCAAAPHTHNGLSLSLMTSGNCDVPLPSKKFTEIIDTRTIRIMNEGVATAERLDCHPFPMFSMGQNVNSVTSKNGLDILSQQISRPQLDFCTEKDARTSVRHYKSVYEMAAHGLGTSSRDDDFQSEKVSQYVEEPATQMKPYVSNKGKAPTLSSMLSQDKSKQLCLGSAPEEYLSNANITEIQRECKPDLGGFAILGREKRDQHFSSGNFRNSFSRQSHASPLLCNSTGNNQLPLLVGELSQEMKDFPGSGAFPNRILTLKALKTENISHGSCTLKILQGPMPDAETTRISIANPADGLARGPATFSLTTRNLVFEKNIDINKSKENQGFQELRHSQKSNRNMFSELHSLSPPLCLGQKGVTIQLLDSSSDGQGNDDAKEIRTPGVCTRNESSAETDTMDIEASKEQNNLSGVSSSTSNKNFSVGHDPTIQATIASVRDEVERKQVKTLLPDMNIIPVPVSSSSMDNTEPSISRTQSLDAEALLAYSEQPIDNTQRPEPSCRWFKRLKLNVSDSFGIATKSSNLGEDLSHHKVKKFFSKIYKSDGKEEFVEDHSAGLLENIESSSVKTPKRDIDALLSHSWIQRWCRKRSTTQKNPEAVMICEPRSTKLNFDELQNKQLPSVGAMALMGKAMNGFRPCELRRRGSFVVWNTKRL